MAALKFEGDGCGRIWLQMVSFSGIAIVEFYNSLSLYLRHVRIQVT